MLHRDVKTWCQDCQACQRRKTPHRRPKLPTGNLLVDRPFQCVSIDLVEYKTESVSPTGRKCSYALTIIDHFTRFSALVALPDKKEQTIAKALVERVFGIFGPPETLHSYQGPEVENKVVKQLQDLFGYKKTKTTSYRPQGNSVSSVCIRPYMPCFRCIAILHRTIGLKSYRSYSSLTIRLLARRCMKRRSS